MSCHITRPTPANPGIVDAGGVLLNARGSWTRPANTNAGIRVVGIVFPNGQPIPVRPPQCQHSVLPTANIQYLSANHGTWSCDQWNCGPSGAYYKLVVWLDVEDCLSYFRATPQTFLAQPEHP